METSLGSVSGYTSEGWAFSINLALEASALRESIWGVFALGVSIKGESALEASTQGESSYVAIASGTSTFGISA